MNDAIKSFAESHRQKRDEWVEKHVLPRLQSLLDEAQSRINAGIKFLSGNGTYGFYFFGLERQKQRERDMHFTDAVSQTVETLAHANPIDLRYRARFPGLVEFVDIVIDLADELDYVVDDVVPTNFRGESS